MLFPTMPFSSRDSPNTLTAVMHSRKVQRIIFIFLFKHV
uniref:Uncharacterized protein n=1 Tax=Anguilla anguilla TaxID=7936 RepID=A0A0E9XUJ8_ANGAN